MKNTLIFAAFVLTVGSSLAQIVPTGFEAGEGCRAGDDLSHLSGWSGNGGVVTDEAAHGGVQSLQLASDAALIKSIAGWPTNQKVAWVDFWIKPVADGSDEPQTSIDLDGARLAFVTSETGGTVMAWDGKAEGRSVSSGANFATDDKQQATAWLRVTIREDFATGTWDLFVGGRPVLGDLGLDHPKAGPSQWNFDGVAGGVTDIDDLQISAQSVLFEDSDNDGLPDAYEKANGLNPFVPDAQGDLDGDGITNFAEFVAGSSPRMSGDSQEAVKPIYVDNLNGRDAYSGRFSYAVDGDGPKASIKSAIEASGKGDVIVVMKGRGIYREGSYGAKGKGFTLTTQDSAIVQ
jgi:hypothetical protein